MTVLNLELIKFKRLALNISLQEMADELGFKNASTYLRYEEGVYVFKANHIPIISSKLNCSIESLFLENHLLKSQNKEAL